MGRAVRRQHCVKMAVEELTLMFSYLEVQYASISMHLYTQTEVLIKPLYFFVYNLSHNLIRLFLDQAGENTAGNPNPFCI